MGGSTMGKFRILLSFLLVAGVFASGASWSGLAVAAEDCPRSFSDERYCDRDGNLTADLPTAPAAWPDPDTIILTYTQVDDPAVYHSVWAGFIKHMSEITCTKPAFFPVQSIGRSWR